MTDYRYHPKLDVFCDVMMVRVMADSTLTQQRPGAAQPLLIHSFNTPPDVAIHDMSVGGDVIKPGVTTIEIQKKSRSSLRQWLFPSK